MSSYIPGNTLVDWPRLDHLAHLLSIISIVPGDIAEVGVYKGGTARWLCEHAPNRRVLLFDTFAGMPKVGSLDTHHTGDFSDTSLEVAAKLLEPCTNYALYKGVFPQQNAEYAQFRQFALVHIDVDIYDSVLACLNFFAPLMSDGGVIVLDDYNAPTCPGAKAAADEWASAVGRKIVPTVQCQAIINF